MFCFVCFLLLVAAPSALSDIPITVFNTHEITWASDIQDLAMNGDGNILLARSNGDGKIYLVDPYSFAIQGEVDLPGGIDGFGLAYSWDGSGQRYYVDSASESLIYHSDGSDSWASFPNPSGDAGAGMDIDNMIGENSDLYQAFSQEPHLFYGIDREDYSWETWNLPGITGEVSGFMVHQVATMDGYPPFALILTTRDTHQFYFYWEGNPDYTLYGQEDCPLPVEESLGLTWFYNWNTVFWSWKGTDGKYYISELLIPVFGEIEEQTTGISGSPGLSIASNPSRGSAGIRVNPGWGPTAELSVFDVSGRHVETLTRGIISSGGGTYTFSGPPGIYTARLAVQGNVETLRFVVTD